jgi:hypothetical protein
VFFGPAIFDGQVLTFDEATLPSAPCENRPLAARTCWTRRRAGNQSPASPPAARDAASIAGALKELLRFGSHILFVDPFFDPYSPRYKSTFRECLGIVKALNCGAICEIHYRYHDDKPSQADLEREAANLFRGVIPADMTVTIYCWREKDGGADFHARYLLTERGGIGIDAGFSAEGNHQTTDMHLMSFELSQQKIRAFARAATDYELVEPVLRIASDGHVEHA